MTLWVISKKFSFSASHVLSGLVDGHPCGRLHGHNYEVEVRITSSVLDPTGFVLDYGRLAPFSDWIDSTLDHRHLNDVLAMQPSAENMAAYLAAVARDILDLPPSMTVSVGVSETPKTWAWWTP